jgi:hypothetical protein
MAKDWYGRALIGSELTGTISYQPIIGNSNIHLRAVKILVMIYGNPTISQLTAKIYSDRIGVPFKELHQSTTFYEKSQITTENNGLKEIFFEFNDVSIQANTKYHVVFQANGYNGTDASHMALMTYFPDPAYIDGFTNNQTKLSVMPIHIVLIGAKV